MANRLGFPLWGVWDTGLPPGVPKHYLYRYELTYPPFLLPLPAPQVCFPSSERLAVMPNRVGLSLVGWVGLPELTARC